MDLPAQLPALDAAVAAEGCQRQFRAVGADVFSADLDPLGHFDLAIVGNVCHLFDEAGNRRLFRRAAAPGLSLP